MSEYDESVDEPVEEPIEPPAEEPTEPPAEEPEIPTPGTHYDCGLGRELTAEEIAALPPIEPPTPEELRAAIPPITLRQARLALLDAGLLDQVGPVIDALPEPDRTIATIEWERASEVRRLAPLIGVMTAALDLTEEQVDALFAAAAAL